MPRRFLPFLAWMRETNARSLRADAVGGITVALVLIPQSMAYAQLAGLPPFYGLYAAFLPPLVASLFGSSRQLATGPVAIVSLMTAATLEPLAAAGSSGFLAYAVMLSLIVGVIQLCLGAFRLGLLVNFLSHPVVTGFSNAAALIIASSQLGKLLGVVVDKADHHYETVLDTIATAFRHGHLPTMGYAVAALAIMIVLRRISRRIPSVLVAVALTTLVAWGTGFECRRRVPCETIRSEPVLADLHRLEETVRQYEEAGDRAREIGARLDSVAKEYGPHSMEMARVEGEQQVARVMRHEAGERCAALRAKLRGVRLEGGTTPGGELAFYPVGEVPEGVTPDGRSWRIQIGTSCPTDREVPLSCGGDVVGSIPSGLPPVALPELDMGIAAKLLPGALVIALLGFMEAISIAKAMAARTGQRLDPNQELIGQGLGCIVGSFTRSYPVSGSFSRSAVNLQAGAASGLSMLFASGIVVVTLLFLTPLLYHLPQSVLASVIMMAVIGLLKPASFVHAFRVHHHDGIVAVVTFVATLVFAPHLDRGIALGVGLSLLFYLTRNMKPSVATLSLHPDGSFRNAERWGLAECRYVSVIRFNGSLIFANANHLEDKVLERAGSLPDLDHVLIVGNGINEIDSSGEDVLSLLVTRLREAGHEVSISGLNDAMVDLLRRTQLLDKIGEENLYRNVARALDAIHAHHHVGGEEVVCPLRTVVFLEGREPPEATSPSP